MAIYLIFMILHYYKNVFQINIIKKSTFSKQLDDDQDDWVEFFNNGQWQSNSWNQLNLFQIIYDNQYWLSELSNNI